MIFQWLNILGLMCDITGAIFLSFGLVVNNKEAIELGVSRLSGNTDEENLDLPGVKDRIKQSKNTRRGLSILIIGFCFQIIYSLSIMYF